MAYIKAEIKEEIPDDYFDNETSNNRNVTSQLINIDEIKTDYYQFQEPEEYSFHPDEEDSSDSDDYSVRIPAKRNLIECENVYVDGEPEVSINHFNGLTSNRSKEDACDPLDPLAIHTPAERPNGQQNHSQQTHSQSNHSQQIHSQQTHSQQIHSQPNHNHQPNIQQNHYVQAKRLNVLRILKAPPVKDLVNRTYSSKCRKLNTDTQLVCRTCKKSCLNANDLLEHRRICNSTKHKCHSCNLIFGRMEYLTNHMKKCPKLHERSKKLPKASQQTQIRISTKFNKKSCTICCIELGSAEELAEHERKNHFVPNAYACHLCDSKFDSEQDALIHLRNTH